MNLDQEITAALTKFKKIAVVGLSPDPDRPSYGVSQYMQDQGYEITPVRPNAADGEPLTILGVKAVASLSDLPAPVEIVDVFRRSDFVPEYFEGTRAVAETPLNLKREF